MTTSETRSGTQGLEASGEVLADPAWLAVHLNDPRVRIVEVDVSPAAYDDWHIDGAVLWNVYKDLKDTEYRLVDTTALEALLTRSGISPDSTVVFYGYAPALGFWLMDLHGHRDVRILNCSRETWRAAGRPWSTTPSEPAAVHYDLPAEARRTRADRGAVRRAIKEEGTTLVDVRSDGEYKGEQFWPSGAMEPDGRAGHVPSAVHQPIDGLYGECGEFQPPEDLRRIFSSIDLDGDNEMIMYCTIGGRAATAWFVVTYLLGCKRVRVYDGSWAEWGRTADAPVELM